MDKKHLWEVRNEKLNMGSMKQEVTNDTFKLINEKLEMRSDNQEVRKT